MFRRRLPLLFVSGLLLCVGGLWCVIAGRAAVSADSLNRIEPGVPYAVETAFNQASIDLPFDTGRRYVLIVGSLGTPDREHRVTLTARRIGRVIPPAVEQLPTINLAKKTQSARQNDAPSERVIPSVVSLSDEDSRTMTADSPSAAGRVFFLHASDGPLEDANAYIGLSARTIADGRRVRVYLDRRQAAGNAAIGLARAIVRDLEFEIIPLLQRKLGRVRDIDGDGKFSVLLTPLLGRLQGGRTSVDGFVRGDDFRAGVRSPFSNHCDMMYLNSRLKPGPHLKTILAHEFAHAVCFSERLATEHNRLVRLDEDDWLNEAIAHLAENMADGDWSNLDDRLRDYLNAPEKFPLVVPDYARAGLWRNAGCRGATYLFLRWCVDSYGEELLPRLIHSRVRGIDNMTQATEGRTASSGFPDLFRRWTVAMYLSGAQPSAGWEGYRSICLRGRVGRYRLDGPHVRRWNVDAGEQTVRLRGTAATYVDLRTSQQAGPRRIRISGTCESGLQVSIVARRVRARSALRNR